jgi:hypothetical protein
MRGRLEVFEKSIVLCFHKDRVGNGIQTEEKMPLIQILPDIDVFILLGGE